MLTLAVEYELAYIALQDAREFARIPHCKCMFVVSRLLNLASVYERDLGDSDSLGN